MDAKDMDRLGSAMAKADEHKTALGALASSLKGSLIVASDSKEYDAGRKLNWAFNDSGYPVAICNVACVEDVQAVVRAAAGSLSALKLGVRAGGHSSFSVVDDSLVVNLEGLNEVTVDKEKRLVTAGSGCKIGAVDKHLYDTGLGFVTGTNGDTGLTGLTLSGGFGFLSREHGFACDNMVEAQIVIATGAVVIASETENADLLRGLRGGGGNFGIVTRLTLKLHDVSNAFGGLSGRLAPTISAASAIVRNWRDLTMDLPRDSASALALPCGKPVVACVGATFNEAGATAKKRGDLPGLAFIDKLGGWAEPINKFGKLDYHRQLQNLLEPMNQPKFSLTSALALNELKDETITKLIRLVRKEYVSNEGVVIIFKMGGAIADGSVEKSILSHRKCNWWVIYEGNYKRYDTPAKKEKCLDWMKKVKDLLMEGNSGVDIPYPMHDPSLRADKTYEHNAYLPEHKRIAAEIKAKYDRKLT